MAQQKRYGCIETLIVIGILYGISKTEKPIANFALCIAFLLIVRVIRRTIVRIANIIKRDRIRQRMEENKTKLLESGWQDADDMTTEEFEDWITVKLRRLGYGYELTPHNGEFEPDLIVYKGKEKTVVKIKRHDSMVGIGAVQQAITARAHNDARRAMVITNHYFTDSARSLARSHNVELWDRTVLAGKFG